MALLGPNGAGKTTTLRSILGLTPAAQGAIRFGPAKAPVPVTTVTPRCTSDDSYCDQICSG